MSKRLWRWLWVVAALALLALLLLWIIRPQTHDPIPEPLMQVHFIDVDQGDAILVQASGYTMLIDAGRHDRDEVVPYLQSVGVEHIHLLVGTHPHADHIGQMAQVLGRFPVEEVWMSGDLHTTRTFERTLDAILESGAAYHEPRAGETVQFGDLTVGVLHPEEVTGQLNDGSIVLRLEFGDTVFLFTGDAERRAEEQMLARGERLRATVLKLAHHGSRTSSTRAFLDAVSPEIAVYSAGRNNRYGHPHREVLERLAERNIEVYGTDRHGSVVVETDGSRIQIATER